MTIKKLLAQEMRKSYLKRPSFNHKDTYHIKYCIKVSAHDIEKLKERKNVKAII